MLDILVFLFENYFDLSAHPAPEALIKKLSTFGFDPLEASQAVDWLEDLKTAEPAEFVAGARSLRIYAEEEYARLGTPGIEFLVFLEAAGVVAAPLRELIIDRALALTDLAVPIEKLKVIALMVLWSREENLEPLIIEELLDTEDSVALH